MLILKASFSKTPSQIIATDLTGLFNNDVTSPYYNLNGWQDSSTALISAATAAKLAISVPDPVTLMPTASPQVFNLYNTLPNYLLASKSCAIEGVDGVYYFTYAVTVTALGIFKYSEYKLFTPLADCCIQNLSDSAICDTAAQKVFSDAYDVWTTMKYSASCGKLQEAIVQLKKLNKICRQSNFGCC